MNQQLRRLINIWLCLPMLLASFGARAQVSITPGSLTYTQDFNGLSNTGTTNVWTNNSTLPGWLSTQATYRAGTGSDNAGALYSFGSAGNSERALGSVASAGASPQYGVVFTNNTGVPVTSLQVSYTGEQWRNGGNVNAQKLTFSYATGSNLAITATGTNVPALDFTSPVTSPASNTAATLLDGNLPANQVQVSGVVTLATPLADGQQVLLRWADVNDSGNDHGLGVDNLTVSAVLQSTVATLTTSPAALTGLVALQGSASNAQTFTLSGTNLDATPVSVSATANIELSTDNSTFTPTLSLSPTADAISQVVYARLTNTAPMGVFSGTITNTANTTLSASVTVEGQVNEPNTPLLTASPIDLPGFTTPEGTPSAAQTYTLTAVNLNGQPINIQAPAGFEIGLDVSTPVYSTTLTISPLSNDPTYSSISVRIAGSTPVGSVTGTITNVAGSLTATVAVSGTVSSTAPVSPYTPIATARAGINSAFTIQGRVTASNQLGSRQIYIQDETGGIAVYSGPSGPDFTTLVQIGDLVQTRGPVTVFNGYLELTGTNNFTVVSGAGSSVPVPVAITPDQLANYQGQLVSIDNATITPVAATFTGGANYTISAGGQSGTLRINTNSPLAGAGQPANPVSVTGVADRFVSGATTTGTNGLQLQPRILADIPGSTPATDLTCTIGSGSPLTRDQTLDIAAWNFEFFGADAGTISCPNNTTLVYNNFGPTNEALQQTNATTVLIKLNADIIAAEEVSDINRFAAAVSAIPGSYSYVCSNRFSYYFQDECDQTPSQGTVFGPTRLAQKVCVIYNTATVTPVLAETKPLLDGNYSYPSSSGWSSGRLPFLFVANITINGITQKIHVVAIHAKSGSATADYNRRKQDVIDLKAELDANYAGANIIILGDYNDKLNGSIATGQQSSYQPFVTDATNYAALTLPLENQGCSTFNSSASFIDHMITSSELAQAYVSNSAYVLQPFSIPNYGNTTSDHNPIEARFDMSLFTTPATALTLVASASPAQILTTGVATLSATVTGGTAPYSYTFSGPGTITPSGNTASISSLTAGVQTFTVTVADATTPTAQTITSTVSVTVSQPTPVNQVPTTSGVANQTATVDQAFSLNLSPSFSDPESQPLTFSVSGLPAGLSLSGSTISGTPSVSGVSMVTVTATDPGSLSVSTPFTITVSPAPVTPPTSPFSITGVSTISCTTVTAGQRRVSFTPQYVGLSGQPISFSVVNELSPTTAAGPYTLNLYTDNPTITLKASQSGTVGEASFIYNWLAACNGGGNPPVNQAPVVINTIPGQSATVGQAFSYIIPANTFSDPNADALTITVVGLPSGLSFTAPATISGTPSVSGVSSVIVTATDPGSLSVSTPFSITVGPAPVTPPTSPFSITGVSAISCTTVTAGQRRVSFTPQYVGLSGQPISFSVVNELSPTTAAGPYTLNLYTDNPTITLKASQSGTVGEASFVYNWLAACNGGGTPPVNQAPTTTGVANQTATVDQAFSLNLSPSFSDPESQPLTFSVSGLPAGLSFTAPATISGTPSVSGVSSVIVTATDPGSLSVSTPFTITVSPAPVTPPTSPFSITGVSTISCTTVTAGQRRVSFTPQYVGLSGQPISFSVVNELSPTTAAGPYTLNLYTDNPTITLKASQSGTVGEASFVYNWLAACGSNARLGAGSSMESALDIQVLGNPVSNGQVLVEVRGVSGQRLELNLTDVRGQLIGTHQIEQAASVERHTFEIGRSSTGMLLVRATTDTQTKTVKVIKAD